jgi:hypothetical protein
MFGVRNLTPREVAGKNIIEIGACEVNGSLRPILGSHGPASCVGVDITEGIGVDVVCDAEQLLSRFSEDTVGTLVRMRRFLKPGGTILTIVPNFPGWLGAIQKMVHPEVYGMHILLDLPDLERVHRMAGFSTVDAGYLGSIASEVVKYPLPTPLRLRVLRKILKKITKTCWFLFGATGRHPETRRFSPSIVYVGIRTADGGGEIRDLPPSRS